MSNTTVDFLYLSEQDMIDAGVKDMAGCMQIWGLTAVIFLLLAVYAAVWICVRMRMPMFKPVKIEKVMAMENPLYYAARKKAAKKKMTVEYCK